MTVLLSVLVTQYTFSKGENLIKTGGCGICVSAVTFLWLHSVLVYYSINTRFQCIARKTQ